MKLGLYPAVSLQTARRRAKVEAGRVAAGDDPLAEREEARAESMAEPLAELAEDYLDSYSRQYKRPAGYQMDRWQLDTYVLPRWGERPIDQITKADVRELLEDLAEGRIAPRGQPTKVAPRNLRALLSKLFDWAARRRSASPLRSYLAEKAPVALGLLPASRHSAPRGTNRVGKEVAQRRLFSIAFSDAPRSSRSPAFRVPPSIAGSPKEASRNQSG